MKDENLERYSLRGVSADKTDVHNAIKNVDKGLFLKHFVKLSLTTCRMILIIVW